LHFLTSSKGGLRFYSNWIDVSRETLRLIWKFVAKKVSIKNRNKSFDFSHYDNLFFQTCGFWRDHIHTKTLHERIEVARSFMPQGFEAVTIRLDGTHTPVNYDRKFCEIKKDWWSYKLKRSGMNTMVFIFFRILIQFY